MKVKRPHIHLIHTYTNEYVHMVTFICAHGYIYMIGYNARSGTVYGITTFIINKNAPSVRVGTNRNEYLSVGTGKD
jgi:hypothetical protein